MSSLAAQFWRTKCTAAKGLPRPWRFLARPDLLFTRVVATATTFRPGRLHAKASARSARGDDSLDHRPSLRPERRQDGCAFRQHPGSPMKYPGLAVNWRAESKRLMALRGVSDTISGNLLMPRNAVGKSNRSASGHCGSTFSICAIMSAKRLPAAHTASTHTCNTTCNQWRRNAVIPKSCSADSFGGSCSRASHGHAAAHER